MDRDEYDRYGKNPEIAKRRQEVRDEFLQTLRNAFGKSLPEGYHGRWESFSPEDLDFLNEAGIPLRD